MRPSAPKNLPFGTSTALFLFSFILFCCLGGCASEKYLPSSKETLRSRWHSYEEIKAAFDKIQPYRTDTAQLKKLGFAPEVTPNVQVLNYLDIIQRFLPNQSISLKDLDGGLQDCLATRIHCQAYEIRVQHTDSERYGNVFMDLFNFHRRTNITGWEFRGLVVLKDNLAVYKLSGGKPNIHEFRDSRNPLGPLQDSGKAIWDMAK